MSDDFVILVEHMQDTWILSDDHEARERAVRRLAGDVRNAGYNPEDMGGR